MDLQVATPEQIKAFQKGAADRYAEQGVAEPVAEALFGGFMNKAAGEMGFMTAEQAERVDETATKIAAALGRERKPATTE